MNGRSRCWCLGTNLLFSRDELKFSGYVFMLLECPFSPSNSIRKRPSSRSVEMRGKSLRSQAPTRDSAKRQNQLKLFYYRPFGGRVVCGTERDGTRSWLRKPKHRRSTAAMSNSRTVSQNHFYINRRMTFGWRYLGDYSTGTRWWGELFTLWTGPRFSRRHFNSTYATFGFTFRLNVRGAFQCGARGGGAKCTRAIRNQCGAVSFERGQSQAIMERFDWSTRNRATVASCISQFVPRSLVIVDVYFNFDVAFRPLYRCYLTDGWMGQEFLPWLCLDLRAEIHLFLSITIRGISCCHKIRVGVLK